MSDEDDLTTAYLFGVERAKSACEAKLAAVTAERDAAVRRAEVAEEALRGVMVKLSAHPELAFARALEEAAR